MRLFIVCAALMATAGSVAAEDKLPEGVEQLLTCGTVFSLRSDDARDAGDEGAALEFYNMGDSLVWQARTTLESAGHDAESIENIINTSAIMTGFSYGAGMGEQMLADCLAAWDSP